LQPSLVNRPLVVAPVATASAETVVRLRASSCGPTIKAFSSAVVSSRRAVRAVLLALVGPEVSVQAEGLASLKVLAEMAGEASAGKAAAPDP
jgi:hypothetical protein